MSEIKSTLDLVMEKTRHLSLSESEKQAQRRRELMNKAKGLVLKTMDGKTTVDHLRAEIDRLRAGFENIDPVFIQVICDALELGRDNTLPVSLLTGIFGLGTQHLSAVLTAYQEAAFNISQNRSAQIKQNLQDQHEISGSSVTPNLKRDPVSRKEIRDLNKQFDRKLRVACDKFQSQAA